MFIKEEDCKEEILENGIRRKIKGWTNDLMVVELTWKKGMEGVVHSHPHRQCCYILKGRFQGVVNDNKIVLQPGDCFYTEADQPHGLLALEDECVCLDIFTPFREDFVERQK